MLTQQTIKKLSEKEPIELAKLREKSFNEFSKLNLPDLKYGLGIYAAFPESSLENINPLKNSELLIDAPKPVEVLTFTQALSKYPEVIKEHLKKIINQDKLEAMHNAFFSHAVFIRIPKNTHLESPINIILNGEKTQMHSLIINSEENTNATIVEHITSGSLFKSQNTNILVKEGAKLKYITIQNSPSEVSLLTRNAVVESKGRLLWIDCFLDSSFLKASTSTILAGEEAETENFSIVFADEEETNTIETNVIHKASKTKSNTLARAVLNNKAKSIFQGLIRIEKNSSGCNGYQKSEAIVLSEDAQANTIPKLEIENNDVRCTHGATISQIPEEQLFYLKSRGVPDNDAISLIMEGFFFPVLSQADDSLSQEILQAVSEKLKRKNEAQ